MNLETRLALLFPLLSAGCGVTFGADAVEHVRDIKADAAGIDELRTGELGVLDEVVVCGGAQEIEASLTALEWVKEGADPEVVPLDFALRRQDSTVTLVLEGGDETVSVKDVELRAPSRVAPRIAVETGRLTVCDFDAPVDVAAPGGSVTLRDVRGPADVRASSVRLEEAEAIDLVTTGGVHGEVKTGGFVSAASANLTLTGPEPGELVIEAIGTSGQGSAYVYLPPQDGFNVRIQTAGTARVEVGDVDYYSADEGAMSPGDGLLFLVNGGGPLIDVTTSSGSITILEDPTRP